MNFTSYECQTIWTQSQPLHNAWLAAGTSEQKAAWRKLAQTSLPQKLAEISETEDFQNLSTSERFQKIGSVTLEHNQARTDQRDALRNQLLSHLQRGSVLGFGFEKPRTLASPCIQIPPSFWKGLIKWDTSTVISRSITIIEIAVMTTETCKKIATETPPQPSEPQNLGGRPSVQAVVKQAIGDLIHEGKIDAAQSMASQFPIIKERVYRLRKKLKNP